MLIGRHTLRDSPISVRTIEISLKFCSDEAYYYLSCFPFSSYYIGCSIHLKKTTNAHTHKNVSVHKNFDYVNMTCMFPSHDDKKIYL